MIDKRKLLGGLGLGAGIAMSQAALAQLSGIPRPKKEIPRRKARTTKLFKAPEFYPNALAVAPGDAGVWVAQQKLKGIQAQGSGVPEQPGPEQVWLMDWNGKVKRTIATKSQVTSALAV